MYWLISRWICTSTKIIIPIHTLIEFSSNSLFLFVHIVNLGFSSREWCFALCSFMINHSSRFSLEEMDRVAISFCILCSTQGTSEYIFIFLLWEVHIIISMWMRILSWVISVILPSWITSQVLWRTKGPVLYVKVANWFSLVVITYSHCPFIGLIVDGFSSQEPLSFFSKAFEDMVWANFHDGDFLVHAVFLTTSSSTGIILSDFPIATLWNEIGLQYHVFWVHHIRAAETTIFMTQSLSFSIRKPIIVCLVMSMIFIEWVVQVTVHPRKLWNITEVHWHLLHLSWLIFVDLSQWIELLIEVRVNNLITPIVMNFEWPLMLNPLMGSWGVKVVHGHFYLISILN